MKSSNRLTLKQKAKITALVIRMESAKKRKKEYEQTITISEMESTNQISSNKLEKGKKVIGLYVKNGVTKFSDIIEDAHVQFGELVKDRYAEIMAAYEAYYNNAPDEEAALLDENIRSIKFEDIIKY